ncbi:hypothetical protein AMATHDRAFT_362 [Amanita thiersii Skay4041]|uniref:GPI inositol-deacylase n=1 Tax=Amanita thiersii Skay4041 TaxID=703135 RepID=A0A2A9P1W5_9AGAR|nr:hypothetical protein AMATHDRAFT_362 [Amanita thiersii Skay4041]
MPTSRSRPVARWLTGSHPDLSLLHDALREPLLPTRPPPARLTDSHHPRPRPPRPPPLFSNLTRSTLPTASLSPPPLVSRHPSTLETSLQSPPIILSHSPPRRSSLDTLRLLSTRNEPRNISTFASASWSTASTDPDAQSGSTASWWWFHSDNKQYTDTLPATDTVQELQHSVKTNYKSTINPVVFCHGLLGFDSVTIGLSIAPVQVTHWRGIKEVLESNGTEVLITRVPATSSYVDRAKVLEEKISQVYPNKSVHLIGHSMGGLDCRYLATHLTDRNFRVLSITTIATPHRGSSFADHFLETVGRDRMPQVLSLLDLLPNGGGDGKAFECLTVEHMRQFNEETPDVGGIKYFSWGARYEPGLIDTWKWPHSVIMEKEGNNDGLVSIESAKWGTYLGTLEHVNHLDLVGWLNPARYKWAEVMGKEIKFRPTSFYLGIVDMLARDVEGQCDLEDQLETVEPKVPGDRERERMVTSLAASEPHSCEHDHQDKSSSVQHGRKQ